MRSARVPAARGSTAATAVILVFVLATNTLGAQSLEQRVSAVRDGIVQFTFAARPGVCGDGRYFIRDSALGASRIENGNSVDGRYDDANGPGCLPGPVRVVATLANGIVTRLRSYAGPVPERTPEATRDLGRTGAAEAAAFLGGVAARGPTRAATDAMLPMMLADSASPWPTLLRVARDDTRPRGVRQSAAFWLSRGAAAKLGVSRDQSDSDESSVRASAVFALSQQPRDEAVPQLIELARSSRHPDVRAQALFWLGQSGDPRGLDVFADVLGVK